MLDTAKILSNVASVNIFDVAERANILEGNANTVYVRLWQSDKKERYVPATGATLQIKFPRASSVAITPVDQSQTLTATVISADDRSIWKVDLTIAQSALVASGGLQLLLTESAVTKTYFVKDVVQKVAATGV